MILVITEALGVLGGSWDLTTTYSCVYKPIQSLLNWPFSQNSCYLLAVL